MPDLPPFDLDATFSPSDAWHDKIEWSITPAILAAPNSEECGGFLYALAGPDNFTRDSQEPTFSSFGWIFGPSHGIRAGYTRNIRKSVLRWGDARFPKPLLSGKVNLRNQREGRTVDFSLEINPSRLIHHHPGGNTPQGDDWPFRAALSSTDPPARFDGEFSLDGNDNWIPQSIAYRYRWRRPWASAGRCCQLVRQAIESEVRRASAISCTDPIFRPDYTQTLQKVETYWELNHPDPLALVWSLKPHLARYSRNSFQTRHYERRGPDGDDVVRNCISILVPLARGETLAVYAKTNRRVRFEIRQNLKLNSKCLGGTRSASGSTQLEIHFQQIRLHCSERMNALFSYLRGQVTFDEDSVSTASFLSDLAMALRTSEHFANVLSLLLTNGKLERVRGIEAEIRTLRRAGIIEIHGPRRDGSYRVTSKYRHALAKLQRKGLGSVFGTRNR